MAVHADAQYGTKVIASDRSNYWRYYGLHRDPFLPVVEDSNFFLPSSWEQYFDLLQYLCESTNVLLSVTGVKGSGKTTFMRQFIAQLDKDIQISRLVGSAVLTAEQLSKTLIKDFNLAKPTGETKEEYWESLCLNLQAGMQPYLLIIDDAHRLPRETLSVLLNLIRQQSEHQMRLHVLLIGELQLTSLLNSLKDSTDQQELIHTITLDAFNMQDTEAYIKHRLLAADLPGGMPLRESDIERIYKLSEGVPGRINAVARQVLIDIMQQRQLYSFTHFVRTRRTQLLGGAVILIIILVLAFILTRGSYDPAFRIYRLLISEKTLPAATEQKVADDKMTTANNSVVMPTAIMDKNAAKDINASLNHNQAVNNTQHNDKQLTTNHNNVKQTTTKDNNAVSKVAPKAGWYAAPMIDFKATPNTSNEENRITISNNSTLAQANLSSLPTSVATTSTEQEKNKSSSATKAANTSNTTSTSITANVATNASKATVTTQTTALPNLLTADSPFLSNPTNYTLQLTASSNQAAIQKFAAKNQLSDQSYYYRTTFRGKDWYVLLYGNYASKTELETTLNNLPESLRNLNPWPRTIASVKQSMSHYQQKAPIPLGPLTNNQVHPTSGASNNNTAEQTPAEQ